MGKFVCYEGFTGFYFLQIIHNKGVIGKFFFLKGLEATKRPGWWPGLFYCLCVYSSGFDGTTVPREFPCLERGFAILGVDRGVRGGVVRFERWGNKRTEKGWVCWLKGSNGMGR
jgi:hypothetical protein